MRVFFFFSIGHKIDFLFLVFGSWLWLSFMLYPFQLYLSPSFGHGNHLEIVNQESLLYFLLQLHYTWKRFRCWLVSLSLSSSLSISLISEKKNVYLYFVTKQWRNTAICTLVNSVPTQNLMPPPKAMKCLVAPFNSTP